MVNRLIAIDTSKSPGSQLPQEVLNEYEAIPLVDRTLTDPRIAQILDGNNNNILVLVPTAVAVNNLVVRNAAAGGAPSLEVSGATTDIDLKLVTKADGQVLLNGVAPIQGFKTTATSGGTATLTVRDKQIQVFTGANFTHIVKLPTTSVVAGQQYLIINLATGVVTVQSSGANALVAMAGGTCALFTALINTPTTAAHWATQYSGIAIASGKKLGVSNTLTLAALAESKTFTFPTDTADVACLQAYQTLLYTRILPRIGTIASSATPAASANLHDQYNITALAVGATIGAPTGVPVDSQRLIYRIKDDGSARTLAYNAIFRALGVTLPGTTVPTKTLYLGTIYNAAAVRWDVVGVRQEA